MSCFLLFRLAGPMASWGEISVGELRPSEKLPTRSALCGLLGAALGWAREDKRLLQLNQDLCYGIRLDAPGQILVDFHTVLIPEAPKKRKSEEEAGDQNAILSRRHYRQDAAYTVAICSAGQLELEQLRLALLAPRYPLYLGRKSCPLALPLHPVLIEGATLEDALSAFPFPPPELADSALGLGLAKLKPQGNRVSLFWSLGAQSGLVKTAEIHKTSKRDRLISGTHRRFDLSELAEGEIGEGK